MQREWENGQDVLESTNGHELWNINGLSHNTFGPKVQGFQSRSEGSTFLVPSEAKGEFCLLLLLDTSNFILIIMWLPLASMAFTSFVSFYPSILSLCIFPSLLSMDIDLFLWI